MPAKYIKHNIKKILTLLIFSCLWYSCSNHSESEENYFDQEFLDLLDSTKKEKPEEQSLNVGESTDEMLGYMRRSPDREKYDSGILIQMASDVPDYCKKLLESTYDRFIIVDKAKMKLFLYDKFGNVEKSYRIACSKYFGHKVKRADNRTSEGFFSAEGIYDSTDWLFTDDNGVTSQTKGQFGPRFIRLKIPNTSQIGIHGTGAPWSLGKRCSHGCIRVSNDNILELVTLTEIGMPIIVSPGPKDMMINESEGRFIPAVATEPGDSPARIPQITSAVSESKRDEQSTEFKSDSVVSGNKVSETQMTLKDTTIVEHQTSESLN